MNLRKIDKSMIVTLAIYNLFIYFSCDIQHLEKLFSL